MSLTDTDRTGDHASHSIEGWEDYFRDGEGFLKTASAAYEKQKKAFTPEILYNLIAMSIEKFSMSALMRHGAIPDNHTMYDLVDAMDKVFPSAVNELREGLLRMDRYQDICSLDGFRITPPEMSEIPDMINTARNLRSLVNAAIAMEQRMTNNRIPNVQIN